jgi:hypothetical protein
MLFLDLFSPFVPRQIIKSAMTSFRKYHFDPPSHSTVHNLISWNAVVNYIQTYTKSGNGHKNRAVLKFWTRNRDTMKNNWAGFAIWYRQSSPTTHLCGCRGEKWYSSYSFTTSALDGGLWSASGPGRALAPGKGPPVPIGQEAEWVPKPVWTQRLEEKSYLPAP